MRNLFRNMMTLMLAFCCVLMILPDLETSAAAASNPALGLRVGYYYRIKNAITGYYLNISGNSDTVGASLIMTTRSSALAQQFQFAPYSSYYWLVPRSTSNGKALGIASLDAATHVGSYITLQKTLENTLLVIRRTANGYSISPKWSAEAYVFGYSDASNGGIVKTTAYKSMVCDWIFEPVYNGGVSYYAITPLGQEDSAVANTILSRFRKLAYSANRYDLPTVTEVYSNTTSCRAVVFHGHGTAGAIYLGQADGTDITFYSELGTPKIGGVSDEIWSGVSFVFFATCQSARAGSYRMSMVESAYTHGVNCVIGFKNNVSGAEDYLQYMMEAIQTRPNGHAVTIQEALDYAIERSKDKDPQCTNKPNSPANSNNITVMGNKNICIDMRNY